MTYSQTPIRQIHAGETIQFSFPILNPDGTPASYNSPVAEFALSAHAFPLAGEILPVFKNSPGNGATILKVGQTWTVTVSFSHSDTLSISSGLHYYSLDVIDGADQSVVSEGILEILPMPILGPVV